MASNDGQKLFVFGMSFAQHDNRKMQQILRHYDKLPVNPGSRAALFVGLNNLAKQLSADEATQGQVQQLTSWLHDGGDFPLAAVPPPVNAAEVSGAYGLDARAQGVPTRFSGRASVGGSYRRYGQGRTLDDNGSQSRSQETAPQHRNDGQYDIGNDEEDIIDEDTSDGGEARRVDAIPREYPAPENPTQDHSEESDDDMDGSTEAGPFYGRGRTLNDYEDSDSGTAASNLDAVATAETSNGGFGTAIPQLRHNQAWRGNNVMGLRNTRGLHIPGPRQMPGRIPLDNDGEEEGWDAGRTLVLGPGRTLNDPEPALDEDDNQHGLHNDSHDSSDSDDSDDVEMSSEGREQQLHSSTLGTSSASDVAGGAETKEIECPICVGQYSPSFFPKSPTITERCDHPDKACLQCISASITEIMKRGALHLLACPICPQKLTRKDIQEYASKEVYERYKYLKQQSEIPGHWISCTNPSCGGSQPHDLKGSNGPKMVCNHCQFLTCAKHRRPWHAGQSCAEFDMDPAQIERLEEEEATAKLLSQETTSICPKCGQGVTKTEGCDHMSCQCGTEWCYVVSEPTTLPSTDFRVAC